MDKPKGFDAGGSSLWDEVTSVHDLDAVQFVQLEEACRIKDRLDRLDAVLRGERLDWLRLKIDEFGDGKVVVDGALVEARQQATTFKQILAALRLPDEATGRKPQQRGGARGAYVKAGKGAKVSSLDAARARAGA